MKTSRRADFGALLVAATFLVSCAVRSERQVSVGSAGDADRDSAWTKTVFEAVGAELELPSGSLDVRESEDHLAIGLFEIPRRPDTIQDKIYEGRISLRRMTTEDFEQDRAARLSLLNVGEDAYELHSWIDRRHTELSDFETDQFVIYRIDVSCADADVLRTTAEIRKGDRLAERLPLVTRLLSSIRCRP